MRRKVVFSILALAAALAGGAEVRSLTIVVAPLSNSTGDAGSDSLQQGLADLLTSALSRVKQVRVIDRVDLRRILDEQKLSLSAASGSESSVRVGRLLGADVMITGGFILTGDDLRLNVHVFDVSTAALLKSEVGVGKMSALEDICDDLSRRLLTDLNLKFEQLPNLSADSSIVANLHFIKGLGCYWGGNYNDAIMEFMSTLKMNPAHAEARFWNARSYMALTEYAHADLELDRFLASYSNHVQTQEVRTLQRECRSRMAAWEKDQFVPIN